MRAWWGRLSGMQRAGAVAAAVVVLVLVAVFGHKKGSGSGSEAAATPTAAASSPTSSPKATTHRPASSRPAAEPTFTYPGDPECAITYRDRGDGSMSWTATVTVPGELITHASTRAGTIYRHDVHIGRGPTAFAAPVPLAQVGDIGGNLRASGGQSYGCSVAPGR